MGKNLAIMGHATRGNEVISLLEMMGGRNRHNWLGFDGYAYYTIEGCQNEIRVGEYIFGDEDLHFFTLEEFLENYPFKVGDKVSLGNKLCTIVWMNWECNTIYYHVHEIDGTFAKKVTVDELTRYKETDKDAIFDSIIWHLRNSVNNGKQNLSGGECEDYFREVVKKNNENKMKGVLAELLEHIKTTPKEDLEKEFNELEEWSNVGPTVEEFMDFCDKINKKPKYPKNYAECCKVLGISDGVFTFTGLSGDEYDLFDSFVIIKRCRDAYWKIAGEEMGLGEPWEPKFGQYIHYSINFYLYNDSFILHKGEYSSSDNRILVFPTEEMRDAFYENFKDLIEQCKELL